MNKLENKIENTSNKMGLIAIGAIFFIFGFASTFIITLSGQVKDIFNLSEFNAQLLSFSFFIAYFLLSIPVGLYIKKIGYKTALIIGLLLMAIGSFLFFPASKSLSYPLFLIATFVLASGVVFLQTSANPYVSVLGSEETASGRLNLVQALNSIATMLAPWIISVFIFKGTSEMLEAAQKAEKVQMPFIMMGIIVLLIAVAIFLTKLPEISKKSEPKRKNVFGYKHVVLGALGIFFYCGAEVGVGGLIINYLHTKLGMLKETAALYAALYWGGAMIGRFFGAISLSNIQNKSRKNLFVLLVILLALLSGSFVTNWNWTAGLIFALFAVFNYFIMNFAKGSSSKSLALFATVALLLSVISIISSGQVSIWSVVIIGMFNSIMFPNIFTLAIKNLSPGELSTASGLINTMIFGGAILPLIMGKIADVSNYSLAFIVPAISYIYILFYAIKGYKYNINEKK